MTRRLIFSVTFVVVGLFLLVCAMSAFPAQGLAEAMAQPSERPPLWGTLTAQALTAAAPPPPPAATSAPTGVLPTYAPPTATAVRPKPTRTRTPTPTTTATPTPTATVISPDQLSATARSQAATSQAQTAQAATSQAATVQAIVDLTATALQAYYLTSAPLTSAPPTSGASGAGTLTAVVPNTQPAREVEDFTWLLWFVILIPVVLLIIALLWLSRRGLLLTFFPGSGRPRWVALKPGRRNMGQGDIPK